MVSQNAQAKKPVLLLSSPAFFKDQRRTECPPLGSIQNECVPPRPLPPSARSSSQKVCPSVIRYDIEKPQLDNEFEALGSTAPAEGSDEFGAVRLGVGAVDPLPQDVPGWTPGLEAVALIESLAEGGDLGFFGGSAENKVVDNEGGVDHQGVHGRLELPKWALMFSSFSNWQ